MTEDTNSQPTPFDFLEIQNRLDEIHSDYPFEILFYGSRERGDNDLESDFNFYLLASTQDQMKPGFVQKVTSALQVLERIATVNLVAGDMDTFRLRLNLMEPSILHMLEYGTVFYGEHIFHKLQKDWEKMKTLPIPKDKLLPFLNRRVRFYKNLTPRTEKDDAVRMERVTSLSIQVWALKNIPDITATELIDLDIPSRAERMIPILYKKEWNEEVAELLEKKKEAIYLKRTLQKQKSNPSANRETFRSRINQLKEGILPDRKI